MGKIVKVSGPLVVATGMSDANMADVVRVGEQRLIGEILNMSGDSASIQVYEETSGLGPGADVVTTGAPLSVELGPGLIENIYDGIQRPLEEIMKLTGSNITRGIEVPALNREKKWHFVPCVEAGAKTGLCEVDEITLEYLKERGRAPKCVCNPDEGASYAEEYEVDLSEITPVVAKPHFVDSVVNARECIGTHIDEAFLGSCNNGRIEELRTGAAIIKGRKVAPGVRFLVVPASRSVYEQAAKEGLLDIFMDAGAIIMNPNCSVCWGSCQGVIGEGETLISTGTRNFKGRAGHKDSFVYLASAATVTASAVKGEIITADKL